MCKVGPLLFFPEHVVDCLGDGVVLLHAREVGPHPVVQVMDDVLLTGITPDHGIQACCDLARETVD